MKRQRAGIERINAGPSASQLYLINPRVMAASIQYRCLRRSHSPETLFNGSRAREFETGLYGAYVDLE